MQSRFHSLLEACLNTASGFFISLVISRVVYPMYGFHASWGQLTQLTVIFTIVSIVRSYLWRRLFNKQGAKSA